MIFAPHILQVKVITPMDKDDFGRDLFPEQVVNAGRRYARVPLRMMYNTTQRVFIFGITALCIVEFIKCSM